jgi:hypothetical protein
MKTFKNIPALPQVPTILDCGHAPDNGSPATVNGKQVMGWQFVLRDGRKICHACDSKRILSCGHNPSPHADFATGAAKLPDGREICYACADAMQRADLKDRSKPFTGYVSSDGKTITTWTGGELMRVTYKSPVRLTRLSYLHGRYIYAIRATDCHGAKWYGRGSPGLAVTLRPSAR